MNNQFQYPVYNQNMPYFNPQQEPLVDQQLNNNYLQQQQLFQQFLQFSGHYQQQQYQPQAYEFQAPTQIQQAPAQVVTQEPTYIQEESEEEGILSAQPVSTSVIVIQPKNPGTPKTPANRSNKNDKENKQPSAPKKKKSNYLNEDKKFPCPFQFPEQRLEVLDKGLCADLKKISYQLTRRDIGKICQALCDEMTEYTT
jgi:hypothetical protein